MEVLNVKELLLSRLETYLLEEEHAVFQHGSDYSEVILLEERDKYPEGFFTSL